MKIFVEQLDKNIDPYKLITGSIVPRPIAWVTTLNENSTVNLAPYSNFTFLSTSAAMLGIGMQRKSPEFVEMKDTEINIRRTGQFVVNIGSIEHLALIQESSKEYPLGVSETDKLRIETVSSDYVQVPRLADVGISMECVVDRFEEYGLPNTYVFVSAFVKVFHIRDELFSHDGRIDSTKLNPVLRIAGPNYAELGKIYQTEYLNKGYDKR